MGQYPNIAFVKKWVGISNAFQNHISDNVLLGLVNVFTLVKSLGEIYHVIKSQKTNYDGWSSRKSNPDGKIA